MPGRRGPGVATVGGVLRVVVLVLLLVATGWPHADLMGALTRLDMAAYWPAWLQVAGIGLAFVVVLLVWRRRRQPLWLLGAELVVAAPLALLPPPWWVLRLGVGGFMTDAALTGFMQPLAMAWLGVVVASAVWQRQPAVPRSHTQDDATARGIPSV